MSMTSDLYDAFYDWADLVLNQGSSPLNIPIIQSHQNAPAPTGQYLVIDFSPASLIAEGYASSGDADAQGKVHRVTDYTILVSFWDVGGSGDALRFLRQSLEWQTIGDTLRASGISFRSAEGIQQSPRLRGESDWVKEYRLGITFGIAVDMPETLGWIQTVELINQIGDQ